MWLELIFKGVCRLKFEEKAEGGGLHVHVIDDWHDLSPEEKKAEGENSISLLM